MKQSHKIALRISLIYTLIGIIWVVVTDYMSMEIANENITVYLLFQRRKSWFYIIITGLILYALIYRQTKRVVQSKLELMEKDFLLQASNEHYQSLFNHNPDAVVELDKEGNFVRVNPEGEEVIGFKESFLKGKQARQFIYGEDQEQVHKYYLDVFNGSSAKFEMRIITAFEEVKIMRCTLLPIIVDGKIIGLFGIARDVTNIRRDEEIMITSEKMSAIGHLAAAVAHEVRNPLTSIRGFLQLMKTTNKLDQSYVDIMLSEVERINLIAGEMLILGKKQDVIFKKENLCDIVNQVLLLMEAQANLHDTEVEVIKKGTSPIYVHGDSNQLKQVFINLIKNGLEATFDHGKIIIEIKKIDNYAFVLIQDNGIGMDEEKLKHLGEPFYSTKTSGTGLGLAVCYKIIERHSGKIEIDSEEGMGTSVIVKLPLFKEKHESVSKRLEI
ncbi:ATP-binding protein [Peribacillus alkalitolerans]|uniref:ATP-binding protein n=1 Tax=Peribacillus alkalitolerans TaxID=1550385 RepID=UPI0013D13DB7|nr:ATP-binding protein [Peribacillus alkalitolerans]